MSKQIKITFTAGEAKIRTLGFTGADCKAASKPYETVVGVVTEDTPSTDASYQAQQQQGNQQNA